MYEICERNLWVHIQGRTRNLISQGHSAIEELGLKGLVGERVKGLLRGGDWGFRFKGLEMGVLEFRGSVSFWSTRRACLKITICVFFFFII